MLNQPLKLLLVVGTVAVLGTSFLSQRFESKVVAAPIIKNQKSHNEYEPPASRSWYSSWFEGMSFRRDAKPAQSGSAAPAKAKTNTKVAAVQDQSSRANGFGDVTIAADKGGQFNSPVEVNGLEVSMLVDTGATVVSLSAEDAQKLGIVPMPSDYTVKISTANGKIRAARTKLRTVRIDNITVNDVDAVVMPEGALHKSLLGMSFLSKLRKFEVASGTLILRP